jgi:hypothetical protein
MVTRRGFLALLGVAALPATAAARPWHWGTVPAGYSGGYHCGYQTRRRKVR